MFRAVASRLVRTVAATPKRNVIPNACVVSVRHRSSEVQSHSSKIEKSYEEEVKESEIDFDDKYEAFLNSEDVTHWKLRQVLNELQGHDLVPEPKIVIAAMNACRRLDDYAAAVRYLEAVKNKCGRSLKVIWPYMLQEIGPTLKELGIDTPEELGYDKPEMGVVEVDDIHT